MPQPTRRAPTYAATQAVTHCRVPARPSPAARPGTRTRHHCAFMKFKRLGVTSARERKPATTRRGLRCDSDHPYAYQQPMMMRKNGITRRVCLTTVPEGDDAELGDDRVGDVACRVRRDVQSLSSANEMPPTPRSTHCRRVAPARASPTAAVPSTAYGVRGPASRPRSRRCRRADGRRKSRPIPDGRPPGQPARARGAPSGRG